MKLRNLYEQQPVQLSLPGVPGGPPKDKIEMTARPKFDNKGNLLWGFSDLAKEQYNDGGLDKLFDYIAKSKKQDPQDIKNDFDGSRGEFNSEIDAVEDFIDFLSKMPLNAEAGGGGGGGGGGAGGGGAGGGAGAGAGAGAGTGAGAGAGASSGGDGGSTSSSGDSGSAGSGDTGSADSTPSDVPAMRGGYFIGSMSPYKKSKKKKKKKKSKSFKFGQGIYEAIRKM